MAAFRSKVWLFATVLAAGWLLLLAFRLWAPAHGLRGTAYANEDWMEPTASMSIDPVIDFSRAALAAKAKNAEKMSVVWEGFIFAPRKGTYRFSISSDDGSWVKIDDAVEIDYGGLHPAGRVEKDILLTRGNHHLVIRYFNAGGEAMIKFEWRPLGAAGRGFPRQYLYPTPVSLALVLFDAALPVLIAMLNVVCVLAALGLLAGACGFVLAVLKRQVRLDKHRAVAFVFAGGLILWLAMAAIAPPYGLRGNYYANADWTGPPALTRLDGKISFTDIGHAASLGAGGTMSAAWEGHIYAPENGRYRFSIRSDDGSWVEVDGVSVIDHGGIHPAKERVDGEVFLAKGDHRLLIKYFNAGGAGSIDFGWQRIGESGPIRFPLNLYPGPVGAGRILVDSALPVLLLTAKAVCVLAGIVLLFLALPKTFSKSFGKLRKKGRSWLAATSASARRRLVPLAAILVGVFLMLLAIRLLSPAHGLHARYFGNKSWEGQPGFTGIDPAVHFDIKEEIAERTKSLDQISIDWEGYVFAPRSSNYRFSISSDDGTRVYLDDALLIDNDHTGLRRTAEKDVQLPQGNHKIRIQYYDLGGAASVDFRWADTGTPRLLAPRLRFYPAPVDRALYIKDTVLGYISTAAKIALLIFGLAFLFSAAKALHPFYVRATAAEQGVVTRTERFLSAARKKIVLAAAVFAAALLLLLASSWISSTRGLTGRYFDNPAWSGTPMRTTVDPIVHFEKYMIHSRTVRTDTFGVLWEGFIHVPKTARYRFTLNSLGNAWLYVDEAPLIEIDHGRPAPDWDRDVDLTKGNHRILIKLADTPEAKAIHFEWREKKEDVAGPLLRLYTKPISSVRYVLDKLISPLVLPMKILCAAAGLFLLLLAAGFVPPKGRLWSSVLLVLFFVMTGVYETKVLARRSTAVLGCDSYAYLQGAERMARTGFLKTEFTDPLVPDIARSVRETSKDDKLMFFLSPHGYYVHDLNSGLVYNLFPPGTSFFLYPFVLLGGRGLAFYALPLLSAILLVLLFYFGSKYLGAAFGLVLAALTMFNVQVFVQTTWIMSDVPSMALIGLAAFLLFKQLEKPRLLWPFLAGACFGIAFLVRYSNLIGAPALAYLMWLRFRSERRWAALFKDGLSFAAGFLFFGLLPLGLYTHRLFGTVFRLVYEPITQSRTEWKNFGPGMLYYLRSLFLTFGIPGLTLMAIGCSSCLARRRFRAVAVTCLLVVLAFFVFYSLQSINNERYLMPAYPFLGVLAGFGLLAILRLFDRSLVLKLGLTVFFVGFAFVHTQGRYSGGITDAEDVATILGKQIPRDAVVFCDQMVGSVRLYLDRPGYRFNWTDQKTVEATLAVLSRMKRPVYFFLDSPPAQDEFTSLIEHGILEPSGLELISRIRHWPLYRVRFPDGE